MADLPSRLDYFALGRDYVVQRAQKIDPAQVDIEGSDVNIFVGVASVMADAVTRQLGARVAALTLDGADDEDLDRYAFDRYQLTRKGASSARTTAIIRRPSILAGAGSIPIGTKCQSNVGEYVTTTTAVLGASDLVTRADVRAVEAGKATQAGRGAINKFSNPSALFDKTLTVSNEEQPAAGGEEAEGDDLFRERVRDYWRTARRGVLSAIEQGALTVPGVVSAMAVEILTEGAQPARLVQLFIADSSGVASDALARDVRVALDDYRAAGIQVLISTSLPLLVDVALRLTFRANVDTLTISDNVRQAVVSFINSLPVNGPLFVGEIYSVLRRYTEDGLIVNQGSIVSPVGDLIPNAGQTIRTTPANVTLL